MLGKPNQLQPKLFYNLFSLEQRVHEDHPLRKVKNMIDFSFIRSEIKDLYGYNGNQSIDPAVILKLMFLLFYENIKEALITVQRFVKDSGAPEPSVAEIALSLKSSFILSEIKNQIEWQRNNHKKSKNEISLFKDFLNKCKLK